MQDISIQKLGGVGACLAALCSLSFVLLVLLVPYEVRAADEPSWFHVLADYALALVGLFGLAVVPAVSARVAHLSEGWVRWTAMLAGLGFAVLAVTGFWQAEYEMALTGGSLELPVAAYEAGPDPAQAPGPGLLVGWQDLLTRAPQGWMEAGGVGLWALSASWLARSGGLLPQGLVQLGLAAGALSLLNVLGAALQATLLHLFGLVLGSLVLMPLWLAWTGRVLLRSEQPGRGAHQQAGALAEGTTRKKRAGSAPSRWVDRSPTLSRLWHIYGDGS